MANFTLINEAIFECI